MKFRQIHAPRTSQQFDRHIKIINLKYLMHFQLNKRVRKNATLI